MKFTPAIQALAERDWLFKIEDSKYGERDVSYVYAIRGNQRVLLATLSAFLKMNKATFAEKLAGLPVEQEAIA